MENLWDRAEELLTAANPLSWPRLFARGSVPREVGAKMVVPREGQPFGTIGGGCGEGEVLPAPIHCSSRTYPACRGSRI